MTKNCDRIQSLLPEYWAETIAVAAHREVEQHLQSCDACRAEAEALGALWVGLDRVPAEYAEPGPNVRARFYDMLEGYRVGVAEEKKPATNWWSWGWRPALALAGAALVLLTVGFFAGRVAQPDPQIATLRDEVRQMRQMLQQQSAVDRLRGVNYAYRLENASENDVVTALLETVRADANVNVRLAAVDAFRKFASNAGARRRLLESIRTQNSPMVQVAIIELLVDLNDQTATKGLEAIATDTTFEKEVRERAQWAVTQLR